MKTVHKLTQADLLDLDGVQRWLEEMASQGLYLQSWGNWWCAFQTGEPKTVRYRLDPVRESRQDPYLPPIPEEVRQDYQSMGWQYVCTLDNTYLLFLSQDPSSPELYSDPFSLDYALSRLNTASRTSNFTFVFCLIVSLLCSFYYWQWTQDQSQVREQLTQSTPLMLPILVLLILLTVYQSYFSSRMKRARQALRSGLPLPHSPAGRRKLVLLGRLLSALYCVLLLAHCGLPMLWDYQWKQFRPVSQLPASILTLSGLEPYPDLLLEQLDDSEKHYFPSGYGTYYRRQSTCLAPERYEILYQGEVPSLEWEELLDDPPAIGPYSPTLKIELWRTRSEDLAVQLYQELWETLTSAYDPFSDDPLLSHPELTLFRSRYIPQTTSLPLDLDQAALFLQKQEYNQALLLRQGSRVAKITYSGAADLTAHLDACAEMLEGSWTVRK